MRYRMALPASWPSASSPAQNRASASWSSSTASSTGGPAGCRVHRVLPSRRRLCSTTRVATSRMLRRGTVVLLQAYDPGPGEMPGEAQDVVQLGPPEAVDGLVFVAHRAQVVGLVVEQLQQPELGVVGVLVLVHQHRPEAGLQLGAHLGPGAQQAYALQQQVAEVQAAGGPQAFLVQAVGLLEVDLRGQLPEAHGRQVVLRGQAAVLGPGDARGQVAQPVPVHPAFHGRAQQRQGVLVVVNREVPRKPRGLPVAAQQPGAEGVEGLDHHPRARGRISAHPLAHLLGRLVGEGHGQDRLRRVAAGLDEMGDLAGDDPRLARAGPGQDEQGAAFVQHRLPLRLVQPGQVAGQRRARR